MHKFIIFLAFFASAPTLTHYVYTGATGGSWFTSTNWTPNGVPNSALHIADISADVGAGAKTIAMSTTPATVNQVNFTNATSNWSITGSGAGILTFGGTNPRVNATHVGIIAAPITLSSSPFSIIGNANITFSNPITAASKTIVNTNTGVVTFNASSSGTMTGGNFEHRGLTLNHGAVNVLGSTGTTVDWYNTVASTSINYSAGANGMVNPVVLHDTGANDFNIGLGTGTGWLAGTLSGTITHNLNLYQATISDMSALVFSGASKIVCTGNVSYSDIGATFQSTVDIDIGDGVSTNGGLSIDFAGTIANTIRIKPKTASASTAVLRAPFNVTYSGPIILNSDANAFTGSIFQSDMLTKTIVYSGVMSNGASGAANITHQLVGSGAGNLTMSGTNTYTSPTLLSSGVLNVTGSIGSSSLITVTGNTATLKGNGTVGPVTTSGTTPHLEARKITSPAVTEVLTISGNLTEGAGTTHTFQSNTTGGSSRFQINGNLTASGTVTLSTATSGQTYTIANYTGTSSGVWTSAQGTITDNTGTKTITIAVP
jgi:fibronectin-binding autotransporter adhesin